MNERSMRVRWFGAAPFMVAASLSLAACVPSVREVESPVRSTLRTRMSDEPGDRAAATAALAQPLTRASVRALALSSPRVEAALASLGVAAGDAAAMRALGRTEIGAALYLNDGGGLVGGDVEVVHDVLDLMLLAPRRRAGDAHLSAAQARAAGEIVAIVGAADEAYVNVAAATDAAATARTQFDAAAAGADLIERIHTAGGTTDLALAREQAVREEARLMLARAETAVEVSREELNAVLGLRGAETRWLVGDGVAELPAAAPTLDDLESTAVATSLELAALRADALAAANRARVAGVKAWMPELSAGVVAEHHEGGWYPGPTVQVGLPLFGGERGQAAAARARQREVMARTGAIAIEVRARARAARMRALSAYDEARHLRDVLLPLRRRVLDETVLQYNAMNAGPLELLAARRELARAELELGDARRRFASAMIAVDTLRRGGAVAGGAGGGAPATGHTISTPGDAGGGGH